MSTSDRDDRGVRDAATQEGDGSAVITEWLASLGLPQLAPVFEAHRIDVDVIEMLDDGDLERMGIDAVGDRKRLLRALAQSPPSTGRPRTELRRPERRPVTLLLCDIVNYTGSIASLDVEERYELLRKYYGWFERVISEFGGSIQRFEGDGVRAVFGFPHAEENAPERAVRAGLELVRTVEDLKTGGQGINVRVAIASGLAMIGAVYGHGLARERMVTGDVAHAVARIEEVTSPGGVAVDADTHRATEAFFAYQELGTFDAGHGEESVPIEAWAVVGESASRSRSDATFSAVRLTPLVSREEEIDTLRRRWARVQESQGQVVLIAGEAGIGKSRLTRDFVRALSPRPAAVLRYYCLPTYEHSALHPVMDFIAREAGIAPSNDDAVRLEKLRAFLQRLDVGDPEMLPLLAGFMTSTAPDEAGRLQLSPEGRLRKTIQLLESQFVRLTARGPILVIMEDAHWMDATTGDLVTRMISRIENLPVLFVLTFRPDGFAPTWPHRHFITSINLSRLSPTDTAEMIRHLLPRWNLRRGDIESIVERTEGVPLFVEEFCEAVLEGGDPAGSLAVSRSSTSIPSVVSGALMSRLDRLGETKKVAQMAAAIGRHFSLPLLTAVTGMDGPAMERHLATLRNAQIVLPSVDEAPEKLSFKHSLLRDAAYENLTHSSRRELHARIAEILATRYRATVAQTPEILAHHLTEAGRHEQAYHMWKEAGDRAIHKSANREAVRHLGKALSQLDHVEDSSRRKAMELSALIARGSPLLMLEDHGNPDVERNYERALELAEALGLADETFSAAIGLWRYHLATMDLDGAARLAQRCLQHAETMGSDRRRREALVMMGSCEFYQGNLRSALERFDSCADIADGDGAGGDVHDRATDSTVMALAFRAWTLWYMGDPRLAIESDRRAVERARQLQHPYSLGFALFYSAVLAQCLREGDRALDVASEAISLSEQQGFTRWEAGSRVIRGWALSRRGDRDTGLAEARHGVAQWSGKLGLPRMQAMLAEVYGDQAMYAEALEVLEEANGICERSGSHVYVPEIQRLMGEFTLERAGDDPRALEAGEAHLLRAVELARTQGAASQEIRAAVALAARGLPRGDRDAPRALLESAVRHHSDDDACAEYGQARMLLLELPAG